MPEFRYTDFSHDVTTIALSVIADATVLIFPTEKSCKEAMQRFQTAWHPCNCSFVSMEELKSLVIYSDHVNLMDEKRLLCLYQAMTVDQRAELHIDQYSDLIDWGQHFFDFFAELADECVDAEGLLSRHEQNEITLQDWQIINLQRLLEIRDQYQSYILARGFSDLIFDRRIAHLHPLPEVSHYVFVNQYYYSTLEKAIIAELESTGRQVTIIWQGKEQWFEPSSLSAKDFTLADLYDEQELPFKLSVQTSSGIWQMAMTFLANYQPLVPNESVSVNSDLSRTSQDVSTSPQHMLVDAKFATQPYKTVFSPRFFAFPQPQPLVAADIYIFFQCLSTGLQSLTTLGGKRFVKLDWLLQAVGIKVFLRYFGADFNGQQKDELITWLSSLADRDIIYIDLDLQICRLKEATLPTDSPIPAFLLRVFTLLAACDRVSSITDLIDLIDAQVAETVGGIAISGLVTDMEAKSSLILRCFYEALANFASIATLQIVDDWTVLYPQMSVAAGIFDLFMQFLKPKTYQVFRTEQPQQRSIVTNLMDTRNIRAAKVTFLNLIEGELPSQRTPVWLLNERQCKSLGLKTWEDIRRWERYYFFRLISSAAEVEIFTIASQDNNVEPSSFVNELVLYAEQHPLVIPSGNADLPSVIDRAVSNAKSKSETSAVIVSEEKTGMHALSLKTLFENLIPCEQPSALSLEPAMPSPNSLQFFNLPYAADADFGSDKLCKLSWSSCVRFIKDPLGYYLRDLRKLQPRVTQIKETMTRKMFGTLLHHYLMVIAERLAAHQQGMLAMKWDWINTDFLQANLNSALAAPILTYQIPQNYNWEYLREVLSPYLIDTAYWFFHSGLGKDPDFQNQFLTLIPETEGMTVQEYAHKLLLPADSNSLGLAVMIRGVADLRLETSSKRFIIDFKTGNADKLQLLFYMWFYYLIEQPELEPDIRSAFYKLMDKDMDWLEFDPKVTPVTLKDTIQSALENIAVSGFAPATETNVKNYHGDISRVDLMSRISAEEEETE